MGVDWGGPTYTPVTVMSRVIRPQPPAPDPYPDGFRVVKLPPNGPKDGQSVSGWLYGKERAHQKATGTAVWKKQP